MNKLSSEVQDVDRCIECNHNDVDENGICQVLGQSCGICGCKCEFPSTSVSEAAKRCPECGHSLHVSGGCLNIASDSDCDCKAGASASEGVSEAAPERIWIQKDTSFFQATGNGTYYRDPDKNSIEYARVHQPPEQNYTVFQAGWDEGFQEAQEPDQFPHQNRCEVRYQERFGKGSPKAPSRSSVVVLGDSLLDAARAAAPHTEEVGEVCREDCQGCNDPVAAIIADRNEARAEAFRRGREVEGLQRFMEHFIVKVEPHYKQKHGKVPPLKSSAWELLAFIQNHFENHEQPSTSDVLGNPNGGISVRSQPESSESASVHQPDVQGLVREIINSEFGPSQEVHLAHKLDRVVDRIAAAFAASPVQRHVLSGFKCRICGSPLVLTHRNASLGQEYAVDETDPVYQTGAQADEVSKEQDNAKS